MNKKRPKQKFENLTSSSKTICYMCGGKIEGSIKNSTYKRKRRHINIMQKPQVKYFCSHDCLVEWCTDWDITKHIN